MLFSSFGISKPKQTKQTYPPSFNFIVKRMAVARVYTNSACRSPHEQNPSCRAAALWLPPADLFTLEMLLNAVLGVLRESPWGAALQELMPVGLGLVYLPPVLTDKAWKWDFKEFCQGLPSLDGMDHTASHLLNLSSVRKSIVSGFSF